MDTLNTEHFRKLDKDPLKHVKKPLKQKFKELSEKKTSLSNISISNTLSKKHKIPVNGTVDDLPLRLAISSIGAALFHAAKYLCKMLSPLSKSEHTINDNFEFINYMRTISIPSDNKLMSFDVKLLFINVPLDFTIDQILKKQIKELLHLCTKNVHFSYIDIINQHCDRVAMDSPLRQVFAGTLMVHLERTLTPKLTEHMNHWKRYVDDTILIIKNS